VRIGVTMSNVGVAPFYYPLTLNANAVDTTTGSLISSKSISVPISNQLDQSYFVYYFDMAVQTSTNIQFSTWLNSPNLVGNQAIVFAISGASTSGIIQLPTMSIGTCATQCSSVACTSYIATAQANGIQGTSYTTSPDFSVFSDPCILGSTNFSQVVTTNGSTSVPTNAITSIPTDSTTSIQTHIILIICLGALGVVVLALAIAAFCAYRILLRKERQAFAVVPTSLSS
jgi:hypothetical protein